MIFKVYRYRLGYGRQIDFIFDLVEVVQEEVLQIVFG